MRLPSLKRFEISELDLMVSNVGELDGQTLATLRATTCEYCTAALGRHTGTETMALGAFALIRLVGALHSKTLSNCV